MQLIEQDECRTLKIFGYKTFISLDTIFTGDFSYYGKVKSIQNVLRVIACIILIFTSRETWGRFMLTIVGIILIGVKLTPVTISGVKKVYLEVW